jgi:hypothetical protein
MEPADSAACVVLTAPADLSVEQNLLVVGAYFFIYVTSSGCGFPTSNPIQSRSLLLLKPSIADGRSSLAIGAINIASRIEHYRDYGQALDRA